MHVTEILADRDGRVRVTKADRDLDAAIAHMDVTHVHCRDYGHAWRPHTVSVLAKRAGYEQALRCGRCATIRRRVLDRYGSQVTTAYDYADGYLVNGLGRLTGSDRDHIRLASVRALLKDGTDDGS